MKRKPPLLKLSRFEQDEKATKGRLISQNSLFICFTLEMPWNNNFRDNEKTPQNEASCIPEGTYRCVKYSSAKFPDVWEITGVPGRTKVLIHIGNFISALTANSDSTGCILPGDSITNYKGEWVINNSGNTMKKLRTTLPEEFDLQIECQGFKNDLCSI